MDDAEAPKAGSRWERICAIIAGVGTLLLLAAFLVLIGSSWLLSSARSLDVNSDSPPDALVLYALVTFARQAAVPVDLFLYGDLFLLLALGAVGRARWHW